MGTRRQVLALLGSTAGTGALIGGYATHNGSGSEKTAERYCRATAYNQLCTDRAAIDGVWHWDDEIELGLTLKEGVDAVIEPSDEHEAVAIETSGSLSKPARRSVTFGGDPRTIEIRIVTEADEPIETAEIWRKCSEERTPQPPTELFEGPDC